HGCSFLPAVISLLPSSRLSISSLSVPWPITVGASCISNCCFVSVDFTERTYESQHHLALATVSPACIPAIAWTSLCTATRGNTCVYARVCTGDFPCLPTYSTSLDTSGSIHLLRPLTPRWAQPISSSGVAGPWTGSVFWVHTSRDRWDSGPVPCRIDSNYSFILVR
ncbi:hypothetical protein C8R45DRAFT_1221419, partial [Mycena sanguinolenta]